MPNETANDEALLPAWANAMTTSQPHTAPRALRAEYQLVAPLPDARADLPLFLDVEVRNTGGAPWNLPGDPPVNLSYHWLHPDGSVADYEGIRAVLGTPLAPGETQIVELHVEPPPAPGAFLLALDMVEEGVGWFSRRGVPALQVTVHVAPPPPTVGQVAIVGALCLPRDAVGNTMIDQLRMFQDRGYQALILVEHIDPNQPRALRQHMARVSHYDILTNNDHPLVRRAVHFFRTSDIGVFHYPLPYVLFEAIQSLERGIAIVDYHGVTPSNLWDGAGKDDFYAAVDRQMKLLSYADYAFAHSDYTRTELLATGAIAAERVFKAGYVVPLDRFGPGPKPPALLELYRLRADQPVILYVGRIASNKRINVLIDAMPLIREHCPDVVLVLVGNTGHVYASVAAQLQAQADALGLRDAVRFTGMVPDEALPDHYRLADLFAIASVHEGFCIPVLEAMASGVPVLGAHTTALPETIGTGGLTFAPENARDLAEKATQILRVRPPSA